LFENPTLADLAGLIEAEQAGGDRSRRDRRISTIRPRRSDEAPVLSSAEQRLWFFDQLEPRHPFYNMPVAARLVGPFDDAAFEQSLGELARRHESLRTTFPATDGRARRNVARTMKVPVRRVDLRTLPPDEREAQMQRLLRKEARKPFDLAKGPLFRCVLYRLAEEEHVVLLAMHHIIVDGWSMGVISRELAVLYEASVAHASSPLAPLEIQYADFAAWQEKYVAGEVLKRELAYWKGRLEDAPSFLELPTDRPRPAKQSFEGAVRAFELSADLSARVHQLARSERTTLFVVLLAAYNVLLSRYSRQEDICVGTVVANRTRRELEGLVGFFANTLVLRTDTSGDPTFRELIGRSSELTLEAYSHQELPFDKLVELLAPERHRSHAPLFQVALVLENMPLELPTKLGLKVEPLLVDNGTAKYDMAVLITETRRRLAGHVEYCTALFDGATIDRMIESFKTLLEAATKDPDRPISRLPLLGEPERRRVLFDYNATAVAQPPPLCLHELVEVHAQKTPDRVAVQCADRRLTYGEVDRQANRLACRLASLGVEPEQPVTVCLERSPELVIALLGVLKAGCAYVPLDPNQPPERLAFLLEDTKAPLVLTEQRFVERLRTRQARTVLFEQVAAEGNRRLAAPPPIEVDPGQLAYIIYTSGSTGQPKGVLIEHRGVVNFVRAFSRVLAIDADSRVLHLFSPSSDGSISDIFSALANGACLVVADGELIRAPDGLEKFLQQQRVTVATLTPSMLTLLRPGELPDLGTVCSVGESITAELAGRWADGRRLINGYGLTETSVGACLGELNGAATDHLPIGRPLDNVQIYLLDPHLEPVPLGVPGEICIGGVQVGRGYLNRPELTTTRFVPDPFRNVPGGRLYRTGDLGRRRPDGTIEFLGRLDDQVNFRGYRVEPEEIASVLQQHAEVDQAAVVLQENQPGAKRLVAYVVPATGADVDASEDSGALQKRRAAGDGEDGDGKPRTGDRLAELSRRLAPRLRTHLQGRLPSHMIPSAFVLMDGLPRTVQGKLDRRSLPPPPSGRPDWSAGYVAPRDEHEAIVARVWEELLGVKPVGAADNFFDLGGHSMLAVRVMAEIERRTGRRLRLASLFQQATVEHLARLLREPETCDPESSLVPLQPEGHGRPFFCVHPAGGTVFCYRQLAEQLGRERPFYGLQAVGIDGLREPHDRVEEMGAHYVAAIRTVQPKGPYLMGGWSLGGNLAFETARQLVEQGEEVGLLALFDTAAMRTDRKPEEKDFLPMVMELFPDEDNVPLAELQKMTPREQMAYFVKRAAEAEIVAADPDLDAGRHVFEVFKTSMQAMIDYQQKPYSGKVTLFCAEHREDWFNSTSDPQLGWGAWAEGGVEVHQVPGGHIHMVLEPSVRVLAEKLRGCLARADSIA